MTIKELHNKWNSMPVYDSGFSIVDPSHPKDIYIGYRSPDEREVRFCGVENNQEVASSKSIEARMITKNDGTTIFSIYLKRKENDNEFIFLVWDMIESCRNTDNYSQCLYDKYSKWYRLLEKERKTVMSFERQKGLLAELLYLEEQINNSGEDVVECWLGPDGADQDFVFEDTWVEVKAVLAAAETVRISSLEQLDAINKGTLRLFFIETTSSENKHSITLPKKVKDIYGLLSENKKDILTYKLCEYGYSFDDEEKYNENVFVVLKTSDYSVENGFPRLTRKNVVDGIGNARYTISLNSISDYLVVEE